MKSTRYGKRTVTITEAAQILGIGRNQAYEAAHAGTLPTIAFGERKDDRRPTRYLVPVAALERLLSMQDELAAHRSTESGERRDTLKKGSVKLLPSGKWMLIYDEPRVLVGKRNQHYETVSVKTEAQARRLLGKRLDTIEAGEFEAPSKMTFGELLDHYFDARKGRLQETTLALYRRTFNHHVRPKIGDVRLDKLTRDHVERVLDDCARLLNAKAQRSTALRSDEAEHSHSSTICARMGFQELRRRSEYGA